MWIVHLVVFVDSLTLSGLHANTTETTEFTEQGKGHAVTQWEGYEESQVSGTLQYESLLKASVDRARYLEKR